MLDAFCSHSRTRSAFAPAPSSSPAAHGIAVSISKISHPSRAPASTIGHRRSREGCAPGKKWHWWAGAIPPARWRYIGAEPNTEWLSRSGVTLDAKGFVRTDANPRRPLETSLPGVFAIGDVRSGSVKRVAASVGEGAQVVAALHAFLAE